MCIRLPYIKKKDCKKIKKYKKVIRELYLSIKYVTTYNPNKRVTSSIKYYYIVNTNVIYTWF